MDSLKALAFIVGYFIIISFIVNYEHKKKSFEIDAKPLSEQTLFRLAIIIPVVSFFYFGFFAWWGKTPVISAHGFKRFIEISTLPLGLLSLAIPFTAVVNNMHRTVQTNEQINQTKKKNEFDLSYSHRKNFIDYIGNRIIEPFNYIIHPSPLGLRNVARVLTHIVTNTENSEKGYESHSYKIESKNIHLLYRNIYSIKNEDNPIPETSETYLNDILSAWIEINSSIKTFSIETSDFDSQEIYNEYNKLEKKIKFLMDRLHLIGISKNHFYILNLSSEIKIKTFILNDKLLKYLVSYLFNITSDIFLYTESDFPSDKLESVSELINSPSFDFGLLNLHNTVYSHENKEIGTLYCP